MTDRVLHLNRSKASPMYSKLQHSLEESKQGRAVPAQWASMIRALTQKGVKSMEIDESTILDWLASQPADVPITKEALSARIESQMFTIKEVRLGASKFGAYHQAGGKYHEYLYIANSERDNVVDDLESVEYEMGLLTFSPERLSDEPELVIELERRRSALIEMKGKAIDFPNHHFSDRINGRHGKNLLAHARITQRPESNLYFIEEIQSDWAQQGRRANWNGVPKGPLVTNTEAWTAMVLRRQLQLAASDRDAQTVAWITETMRNGGRQNKDAEAQKVARKKLYDDALQESMADRLKAIESDRLSAEALVEAKRVVRLAVISDLATRRITEPTDMLNDFYLKVIPKIVDKMLAGTGEKVEMRSITIGPGNVAEVPSIALTDAVRQRLSARQPVYSRGLLLNAPRQLDDPVLVGIVRNASTLLGSVKHFRLASHIYDIATGRKVAGRYINGLTQLSLSALDIDEACNHECFHFAQDRLFTQHENQVVRDAFAPGTRLNDEVRRVLTSRGDFALAEQCLDADESAAQGFALWRKGLLSVTESPVQGLFSDLLQAVRDIIAWIRKEALLHGYQKPDDIFKAFASGEIAQREAEFQQQRAGARSMA